MRLSGLVIAALLLVSTTLLAQHSSGGGSSSGGGYSGGSSHSSSGYSGGYSSSGSSHASSGGGSGSSRGSGSASSSSGRSSSGKVGSSAVRSANDRVRAGANVSTHDPKSPASVKPSLKPEKKSFVSFLRHPFKKSKPVATARFKRPPCRKEPCAVCPPGESRNGRGACGPSVVAGNVCQGGQSWNGFACGTQYWFNDCRDLANQLAAQERQMRGQNDPGQSLRHQLLQNQYEQCLRHFSLEPFGGYAFNDVQLLDVP